LRILAIENFSMQNTIAQILKKMGYEVATSEKVQDILSARKNFDLIFINLGLLTSEKETIHIFNKYPERPYTLAVGRADKYEDYQQYAELTLDDYLALPIPEQTLKNILYHWQFRQQIKETGVPLSQFNTAELMARIGYNPETLKELALLFEEDVQCLLGRIYDAIREQDGYQLKKATHELKGICATLSAKQIKKLTEDLKKLVHAQALQDALRLFEQLERGLSDIQQTLRQLQRFLAESQPSKPLINSVGR
jgi:HPt (histidine-containing phosphotransfer) domain-containing protein